MEYGVFLTRAQPVTLAHVGCIRQMLSEVDHALIIIGSANKSGMLRNPFPISLRLEMMHGMIEDTFPEDRERITVMPLSDLDYANSDNNPRWGKYLYDAIVDQTGSPNFAYYTGEPIEQSTNWFGERLGREITPRLVELTDPNEIVTATDVRNAISISDTQFLVNHCPMSVIERYYNLLLILLKVYDNPLPDFSTL